MPNAGDESIETEKNRRRSEEWRSLWPHHCKTCHGWGGAISYQSQPYGAGPAQESIFDPCDAPPRIETCHRCGQDGLSSDGDGPCSFCGWNYDDGDPETA